MNWRPHDKLGEEPGMPYSTLGQWSVRAAHNRVDNFASTRFEANLWK